MYITYATIPVPSERTHQVEAFLQRYLAQVGKLPGVRAVYHHFRPDKGDEMTLIVWESEADARRYQDSDLLRGAGRYAKALGLGNARREGYDLPFAHP
ncbi:MAG: hypothetical protein FJ318_04005 [SAR202 cluster bacterium]|nr:hypothetical protein [SAR202 cluster bacterium]